jgi:hypothetical protein
MSKSKDSLKVMTYKEYSKFMTLVMYLMRELRYRHEDALEKARAIMEAEND